ncbi:MAG: DUF4199 domain-containing protein [Hydrogenophilaceae bacterium]|jgi:uncharacterized membrane protein YhaH (DUF805 family)|nr:DUF4199 domain-containing protein [Hydrogenophilaceae bacterium]
MRTIALSYGGLAGALVISAMIAGFLLGADRASSSSVWLGYLTMVVALSLIFLGVKRYRDVEKGGVVKFLPAFLVGLAIAAVAGVVYVVGWEIYLAATGYAFMGEYTAAMIEAKRAAAPAGPALDAEIAKLREMEAMYANPVFRVPITFLEIFPVGLVIALISAALLRNPKVLPRRAAAA